MKHKKRNVIIGIVLFIVILITVFVYSLDFTPDHPPIVGVTFSQKQAEELSDSWQEMYTDIIEDLGIKHIRLVAYWDNNEMIPGYYDFKDLHWQLKKAQENDVDVTLAIGRRVPRFPECFTPEWIDNMDTEDSNALLLAYLETLVKEFKQYDAISYWQVENEYFLSSFGFCDNPDPAFLQKEIDLVRSLDDRPILVTHSGELGDWNTVASYGDAFGTTMYRIVWNEYLGTFTWRIPAAFYKLKAWRLRNMPNLKKVFVAELQGEPWGENYGFITDVSIEKQFKQFDLDDLKYNIRYAQKAGFDELYLWGVEWWWWLRENDEPEFWEYVKELSNTPETKNY